MSIFKQSFRQAWKDTLSFFGWSRKQIIWPVLFAIGLLFHSQWADDRTAPWEEVLIWATYTLAPAGAVAMLLFLWNLVCAPYRIERDRRIGLEADRPASSNSERVRAQESFPLWEAACLLAGTPIQKNPTGEALACLHQIKSAMVRENIEPFGSAEIAHDPGPGEALTAISRRFARMASQEHQIATISDNNELAREDLLKIAARLNRRIPGLTDEPRSLQ